MYTITNIYLLAAIGTIGGALFGFDISSMSAWIAQDQYLDYFNYPGPTLQGGITASMSAGSFVGALCAGYLSDWRGRRFSLQVASIIWIIGSALQCSAQNVTHLIIGRVVSGLAVGITSSQVCVYLAELAPGNMRGRIVGMQQWAIEWGILIMYLIAYGCASRVEGPSAFRIAWGVQGIPGLILFGGLFFFPESPRWYAAKDRMEDCVATLALLHGNGDREHPMVQAEFAELLEASRLMAAAKKTSFWGLFSRDMWRRTMCGVSVQMEQQLLGGNVAMYYIVYVFQMAGLSGDVTLYSSAIQYVIFLVTTGGMLFFIDKIGRRTLLLVGAALCMVLHFAIAGTMASYGHPVDSIDGNSNLRWQIFGAPSKAVIACSYIFVGIYGLTWAPAAWVYSSEVFPLQYRAKGVGLSAAVNWIFNFALAFFVAPAFANIVWKTYIIFGVFCAAMTVHVFFMFPETQGKTLEEIDAVFDSKVPAWRSSRVQGNFQTRVETARNKSLVEADEKKDASEHRENV